MITADDIEEISAQAKDKEEFREILANHFFGLDEPCSVSIGVNLGDRKVSDVVKALRSEGINAAGYYNPKVQDLDCFVVDGTGIKTPYFAPKDALKATVDVVNVLAKNDMSVRGYALPITKNSMTYARAFEKRAVIEVAEEKSAEDNFIRAQLKKVQNMPKIDVEQVELGNVDKRFLFRGGMLGNQPYGVVSSRRARDVGYASPSLKVARDYADGTFSLGVSYNPVDQKHYGFIYAYAAAEDQKYFDVYGIENRGKYPVKNGQSNPYYETPLFEHRNPLMGVFLKYGDDVVQIADRKGYFSEEWKKFANLHTVYSSNEKNDFMVERANKLKSDLQVVSYHKIDGNSEDERTLSEKEQLQCYAFSSNIMYNEETQRYAVKNLQAQNVVLPKVFSWVDFVNDVKLENVSFAKAGKILDLSQCKGDVILQNCDLSGFESVAFPKECQRLFLGNVKLPEKMSVLDLSDLRCQKSLVMQNQDLSNLKGVVMPQNPPAQIHFWGENKLPEIVIGIGGISAQEVENSLNFEKTNRVVSVDKDFVNHVPGTLKNETVYRQSQELYSLWHKAREDSVEGKALSNKNVSANTGNIGIMYASLKSREAR